MDTTDRVQTPAAEPTAHDTHRDRLLTGIPVTEQRHTFAGVSTAVLEGGEGAPIVLLHGPGESAVKWRWVIPDLVTTHRVIAPDLPAHANSDTGTGPLDTGRVLEWLDELIETTCPTPPVLVGHVLGGSIAARFARKHPDRVRHLVLVDSLGLARFRPTPRFALGLIRFQMRPSKGSYERFMRQCAYDLDVVREGMGADWEPFVAYNVDLTQSPKAKTTGRLLRQMGLPRIPREDLAKIEAPTTLVWGRYDRANRLRVAERASARYGWPLHVIHDCADDPPRDQPEAFLEALRAALDDT